MPYVHLCILYVQVSIYRYLRSKPAYMVYWNTLLSNTPTIHHMTKRHLAEHRAIATACTRHCDVTLLMFNVIDKTTKALSEILTSSE